MITVKLSIEQPGEPPFRSAGVAETVDLAIARAVEELALDGIVEPLKHGDPASFERADLDLITLALAELALSRPGWRHACREIAGCYGPHCPELFDEFQRINADRVKATRGPSL